MNPGAILVQPRRLAALAAFIAVGALLHGLPAQAQSRGQLLYSTHCIACHTSQVHWRDRKLATDWNSLRTQVRHWQDVGALGWSEDDILDVTRYLNETFYGFEPTSDSQGAKAPAATGNRDVGFGAK